LNEEVVRMETTPLREIANELTFLKSQEDREKLLAVVGALVLRKISLAKASEIMGLEREVFLGFLDALGVEFSYSKEEDIDEEKTW
jgi:predicted HTH domain antitoxin